MGALKVLWQMSRSLNFDFRKVNPHHSAWSWKNWEAGGLGTLVQGWGRLGTGVNGWAEDGENQEDPWGWGRKERKTTKRAPCCPSASERKQLREEH